MTDPNSDARRSGLVALAVLAAAFIVGAAVAQDPDCDVTFGIEAWRRFGPTAAAVGAAVVGVLIVSRRAADAVAAGVVAVVRPIPRPARVPLLLAAALALFVAFPDVSLSGDSTLAVSVTILRQVSPSNALTNWLDFAASDAVAAFGLDPVVGVRTVSWASGAVGVACGVALARTLFDDGPRRAAAAFLFLTTGSAALFFGSIEIYAPLGAAVLAYLLVCVRAMRGVGSPHVPPLVLGVAFALHGSAGLLLPSLALVAWGSAGGRAALRRAAVAGALFVVPVVATFAGLWFGTWRGVPPAAGPERWGNFFGAQGHGPLLALRLGPGDIGPRYALLDAEHALAALVTIFVAAPAAWAALAAAAARRRVASAAPAIDRRLVGFAVAALAPWLVYACVWNVSYSLRRDWDMFSPLGALAAFAAAVVVLRQRDDRAAAVRVAALCLFGFVPFVASHAGDFKIRRGFAMTAASTIERAVVPGQDAARAAWVRRWDEESRRLDETGAAALIDEGDALTNQGRLADAVAKYGAALAAEPDNLSALFCRGTRNLALGRRDDARRDLAEVLRLSTANENVRLFCRHELGRLAVEDGDLDAAARMLGRALRECSYAPQSVAVARDLAAAWRRLGREDVAGAVERWAQGRARR